MLTAAARDRFAEVRGRLRLARYADPASEEARAAAGKMRQETEQTPVILVVMCAVSPDEKTREEDYAAAMMATATLIIAAQSLGLGTYLRTGGIMQDSEVVALAGLEPGFRIVGIVSLGYPEGEESPRRRRPASELTRWASNG